MNRPVCETAFAIVDLETTGLNAGADRIIEIAVVRKEPGRPPRLVLDTLVNPRRFVAATEVHGITDDDVQDAPDFESIAGLVADALTDCVVAAYNVYFDMRFLSDEFVRVGLRRDLPHVCLMYLRPMLELGPRRSLKDACEEHGIHHNHLHIASADAEASSRLMDLYLRVVQERGLCTFKDLAGLSTYKFLSSLQYLPLSTSDIKGPRRVRGLKARGRLVSQPAKASQQAIAAYWDALTAALTDLDITEEERESLEKRKRELGLATEQVRVLHARAFGAAISQVTDDEWLHDEEQQKLAKLYHCLCRLGWAPGQ